MQKGFSVTILGVLVTIGGTLLVQFGFTETCANEITAMLPAIVGGLVSYFGRYRIGDIDTLGRKK